MDNSLIQKIAEIRRIATLSAPAATWMPAPRLLQIQGQPNQLNQHAVALHSAGVPFTQDTPQEINIPFTGLAPNTTVYYQQKNFLQTFHEPQLPTNDLAIVDWQGSWVIYEVATHTVHRDPNATPTPFLISNAVAYHSLLPKLKGPELADYYNPTDKEIVLYSPQKGIKKIAIPQTLPDLNPAKDLAPAMIALRDQLAARSGKDFAKCFKDILAGYIPTAKEKELEEIIVQLPALMAAAENNLQVYYKGFSFETLRTHLLQEKDKYFATLRDILGRVMAQIVGLPVSLAASVYTTYRSGDNWVLAFVLLAWLAYAGFTHYLQSLVLKDLDEIQTDFSTDFDTIANSSGLPPETITRQRETIDRRIRDIRRAVRNYRILLWTSAILFAAFIVYQSINNADAAARDAALNFSHP